jgi:hypothetical protein
MNDPPLADYTPRCGVVSSIIQPAPFASQPASDAIFIEASQFLSFLSTFLQALPLFIPPLQVLLHVRSPLTCPASFICNSSRVGSRGRGVVEVGSDAFGAQVLLLLFLGLFRDVVARGLLRWISGTGVVRSCVQLRPRMEEN